MRRPPRLHWLGRAAALAAWVAATACGPSDVPSPFLDVDAAVDAAPDAPPEAAPPEDDGSVADSGTEGGAPLDPGEWGPPCVDDARCDDGIDCTADSCDPEQGRCHFVADDAPCDDGVFCNGEEACVAGKGCRGGEPVACSDGTPCTIDACVEATRRCTHVARDADADGDPDGNCVAGADCNDGDPAVSSLRPEICGNSRDDDCDGVTDEADCEAPEHDRCDDPLVVKAEGSYRLRTAAATSDYAATCAPDSSRVRDLALSVVVPDGPKDVELVVTSAGGAVAIVAEERCGEADTESACAASSVVPSGQVARLRLRDPGAGAHAFVVFVDAADDVGLGVAFPEPAPAPGNETCGTAEPLAMGTHALARLAGVAADVTSRCGELAADLFYELTLDAPADVRVYAAALDPYGVPLVSLRDAACVSPSAELDCRSGDGTALFRRALPAGTYLLAVGATGPADVDVVVESSPPSVAPPDDTCATAPSLVPGEVRPVDLGGRVNDAELGCMPGAPDVALRLTLDEPSDVLLVLATSDGDEGAVSLARPACAGADDVLACGSTSARFVRTSAQAVPAGDYRVIVESERGSPATVTALVRPTTAPALVPFSDACGAATEVPPWGGRFEGNTANAADDLGASCDFGDVGAPDQLLHLSLPGPRRVVLDARGTAFTAIVDVRSGASCPGEEVRGGCSAGYERDGSYLDLELPAGDYWIQVDGYQGASGAWTLDVFATEG